MAEGGEIDVDKFQRTSSNYRCLAEDHVVDIKSAVHEKLEESRSVYNFVVDVLVARQVSMSHQVIDATVMLVDSWLESNRKKRSEYRTGRMHLEQRPTLRRGGHDVIDQPKHQRARFGIDEL